MPTLPMAEYPRPRSWEEFEEICWDLFLRLWNDPNTVRHGRNGQRQSGVDLFGRLGGQGPTVGAQCKLHQQGEVSTWDEVEEEVKKAEQFRPPLTQYTIVTTAPRDASLQQKVRELNEDRGAQNLFPVAVLFWDDICSRLADHPAVLQKHFPSFFHGDDSVVPQPVALSPNDYLLAPRQIAERLAPFFDDGKEIVVRRFIRDSVREFYRQPTEPDLASVEAFEEWQRTKEAWRAERLTILDAILTAALEAVEYDNLALVEAAHNAFYQIYERAHPRNWMRSDSIPLDAPLIWSEIVKRVYLLGATLLERGHYAAAAGLINQPITWDEYWAPRLWARHALTELANSRPLGIEQLVSLTLAEADREPYFLRSFVDRERALNRLCQFDFLQCLQVVHRTNKTTAPSRSFAHYYTYRTEPIVSALVTDPAVRSAAVPGIDDARLAEIITALDRLAGNTASNKGGWDSNSWSDGRIRDFLASK